jgi:hypothetical protein
MVTIVSLCLAIHYSVSLFGGSISYTHFTALNRIEDFLLRPAAFLVSAVLPTRYTTIDCEGALPNTPLILGTALALFNTILWIGVAALGYVALHRWRTAHDARI